MRFLHFLPFYHILQTTAVLRYTQYIESYVCVSLPSRPFTVLLSSSPLLMQHKSCQLWLHYQSLAATHIIGSIWVLVHFGCKIGIQEHVASHWFSGPEAVVCVNPSSWKSRPCPRWFRSVYYGTVNCQRHGLRCSYSHSSHQYETLLWFPGAKEL